MARAGKSGQLRETTGEVVSKQNLCSNVSVVMSNDVLMIRVDVALLRGCFSWLMITPGLCRVAMSQRRA